MAGNGIIQSGLSGKTLMMRVPSRRRTRSSTSGEMGPPLITSMTSGRQAVQSRSSRPNSQR